MELIQSFILKGERMAQLCFSTTENTVDSLLMKNAH